MVQKGRYSQAGLGKYEEASDKNHNNKGEVRAVVILCSAMWKVEIVVL